MPEQAFAVPASATLPGRLALIVPLALERDCLKNAPQAHCAVEVLQSGQGELNARRAARTAIGNGATAILSLGVAGALDPQLAPGDAVVPDSVLNATTHRAIACTAHWRDSIREHIAPLCRVADGALLSVSDPLTSAASKAAAAREFDAVACDMESAAIAAVADEAGLPFAALRIVSDTAVDELPADIANWIDPAGNARLWPVLTALANPLRWSQLMAMNSGFRLARHRLRQLSESLADEAWCCPQR